MDWSPFQKEDPSFKSKEETVDFPLLFPLLFCLKWGSYVDSKGPEPAGCADQRARARSAVPPAGGFAPAERCKVSLLKAETWEWAPTTGCMSAMSQDYTEYPKMPVRIGSLKEIFADTDVGAGGMSYHVTQNFRRRGWHCKPLHLHLFFLRCHLELTETFIQKCSPRKQLELGTVVTVVCCRNCGWLKRIQTSTFFSGLLWEGYSLWAHEYRSMVLKRPSSLSKAMRTLKADFWGRQLQISFSWWLKGAQKKRRQFHSFNTKIHPV